MTAERPPVPYAPREGFRWVPGRAVKWRLELGGLCRRVTGREHAPCPTPAVAALNRGRHSKLGGRSDSWWRYCADHMYGKWIEDGQVWEWRLEPDRAGGSS